ncbi:hypothetical protein ACFXAZ_10740 [Streptomyces sp. NPDC059477]|uniref:hypothetical protein n=1 Tax=Streptomyces sp. NPDC059477 TaxID=3346847 RepID=UPI0036B93A79
MLDHVGECLLHDAVRLKDEVRRKAGPLSAQVQPGAGAAGVEASDQPPQIGREVPGAPTGIGAVIGVGTGVGATG